MDSIRRLLWWMLAGSSGGQNRGRIIMLLRARPSNAHQMAKELGLDYKTVRHHIDVMMENQMLSARGEGYGRMYFLSPMLETNFLAFEEIWGQIGKTQINKEPDGEVK
jgi:DNA-binding transcriptional ArsR family regulator